MRRRDTKGRCIIRQGELRCTDVCHCTARKTSRWMASPEVAGLSQRVRRSGAPLKACVWWPWPTEWKHIGQEAHYERQSLGGRDFRRGENHRARLSEAERGCSTLGEARVKGVKRGHGRTAAHPPARAAGAAPGSQCRHRHLTQPNLHLSTCTSTWTGHFSRTIPSPPSSLLPLPYKLSIWLPSPLPAPSWPCRPR